VTENFALLDLEQYSEYCFQIDSYPVNNDGYWSKSVDYCASTGVRGKQRVYVSMCSLNTLTRK